jgi:predicted nucleotidyltransferase
MIVLTDKELAIVKAIILLHAPEATVYVFGSRCDGVPKQHSDLDLMFDDKLVLSIAKRAALAEAFSESSLPFQVDIVDVYSISDEFKALIDHKKEVIYP